MTWYVVCEITTGRLVSVGQVVANPLPEGLESISLSDLPPSNQMWDELTKSFINRPTKVLVDRLQDIITHSDYADDLQLLWASLNVTQRNRLRSGLIRLLGQQRWRASEESISLGGIKDA